MKNCPKCEGRGQIVTTGTNSASLYVCLDCGGSGLVRAPPCDDHRPDGPDPYPGCKCAEIDRLCASSRRAALSPPDERLRTALQRIRILATNGNPMSPTEAAVTMDMVDEIARAALSGSPSASATTPSEGADARALCADLDRIADGLAALEVAVKPYRREEKGDDVDTFIWSARARLRTAIMMLKPASPSEKPKEPTT